MVRAIWIVGMFLTMYLIATILGFATYLLLSPLVMWVTVFTVMPLVSAALLFAYLRKMNIAQAASLKESLLVAGVWILLSFIFDAAVYIVILPLVSRAPSNWSFFRAQSPWIWLCYGVLLLSAVLAHKVYGRQTHA